MSSKLSLDIFQRVLKKVALNSFSFLNNTARKKLIYPIITPLRKRTVRREVVHLHGPASIATAPDELSVVCLVRNGEPWIRSFLDHYYNLGAVHICFMDNGSTDATVRIAQSYDRVTILKSDLPYGRYKHFLKWYLTEHFAGNGWMLVADIDELFNYPMSNQLELAGFLSYLNHFEYTAVATQMLDMYANRSLKKSVPKDAGPLMEIYDCYELDEALTKKRKLSQDVSNTISNNEIKRLKGGVRKRLFGAKPVLTKFSLLRLYNTTVTRSKFSAHRISGAKIADVSCVLLHYKLIDGFYDYTDWAVSQKCYYKESMQYRIYQKLLHTTPELNIAGASTRTLRHIDQLVDEGFLVVSDAYKAWVADTAIVSSGQNEFHFARKP